MIEYVKQSNEVWDNNCKSLYLDYVASHRTIRSFARYSGINFKLMEEILDHGKIIHEKSSMKGS